MDIIFACLKDDQEFRTQIESTFSDAEEIENFSVSGMEELVYYIIPISAFIIQLADFILTHFNEDEDNDRYVIINGQKKVFKGYTTLNYFYFSRLVSFSCSPFVHHLFWVSIKTSHSPFVNTIYKIPQPHL